MGSVYNLLLFPTVKEFENLLGFDEVAAIGWWFTVLGHSVDVAVLSFKYTNQYHVYYCYFVSLCQRSCSLLLK